MNFRGITAYALLVLAAPVKAQPNADHIERIEGPQSPNRGGGDALTLQQIINRSKVPGVSIAVIHNFEVQWTKSYGVADIETGTPVVPDTLFQAASMSKPVAALASLKAVQMKKFGWIRTSTRS